MLEVTPMRCLSMDDYNARGLKVPSPAATKAGHSWGKLTTGRRLVLHALHPAGGFETTDASRRQGAGQPVKGGKWGAVVEDRGHLDHHGEIEVTSGNRLGIGAERSSDLGLDDPAAIRSSHPVESRSPPVMKSQMWSTQVLSESSGS